MGNGPIAAGTAAGVHSNDLETLRAFLKQVPDEHKDRLKAAIEAVKTPRAPEGTLADSAPAVASTPAADTTLAAAVPKDEIVLSADQLKNIRTAFDAIDTTKNGTIEAKEFIHAMKVLDMEMSEDDCKAVFKSFDLNGDERLQFEEYVNLIKDAMKEAREKK